MDKSPIVSLTCRFSFDSAHRLDFAPQNHRCRTLHGHTYTVEIEIRGAVDPKTGWLMDYDEIIRLVKPLVNRLDHQTLNEVKGLKFTTAEEIAVWFWERLKSDLLCLSRVSILETPATRCDFYGSYE